MAERKKTYAETAASKNKSNKNKKPVQGKSTKSASVTVNTHKERQIPVRLISSVVCLGLFILFLVIFFEPQGALVKILDEFFHGLFGRTGFLVAIPGLLYLFFIHAFSGKRPIRMRTVCVICFVLTCGCIAHLALAPVKLSSGVAFVSDLYEGGIAGTTGGFICGGIACLLQWLCGTIISYILLIVCAIFTLLGAMQITISSIIRAIQDRPRAQWDVEEKPKQEPASIVVNHIANKHIEHLEKRRAAEQNKQPVSELHIVSGIPDSNDSKADDILRQIDSDVASPVAAAGKLSESGRKTKRRSTAERTAESAGKEPEVMPVFDRNEVVSEIDEQLDPEALDSVKKEKVTAKDAQASAAQVAMEIAAAESASKPSYAFPPIDLLRLPASGMVDGTAEMRENSRRLNETLASFKIEAHIINVTRGPSVTRYEVELEKGVRLNKLTTAADDIALSLGATGVRIAAVPGKISVVGIEVPNRAVTTVSLREVIDSQEFARAESKASFSVGKDISGNCIVGNIARLPHMLIAGTTGSGKSVCMNSIIISLLYKASPDDVKLIMVDPKMVELGIYNGIPHLLIPVVTDPKKAAGSLQWAVTEMLRRYKMMSDAGVRDLESYNSIMENQEDSGSKLAQIVVIIDELADLMLVAAKEVEESICRIAQMGRAAGIHLIIATQRPSADVITGLMKANIPSRIAFSVASAMESRIILDTQGAEKLVGKGDMLYAPIGNGKPKRVQGCFVSDSEVEAVATYVKEHFATNYDQGIMEEIEKKAAQTGTKASDTSTEPTDDERAEDEMLPQAVEVILETGQASVSMLQRRLKLGYARAARIVDEMENLGVVGPYMGSKPRTILVTREQWQAMRSGQSAQMNMDDYVEAAEEDDDAPF